MVDTIMPIPGLENYQEDPDYSKTLNVVGMKSKRRIDGYEKVSGKAVFSRDYTFPGTLYARELSCPYANATIKSMDTSKAAALPGVRYILRYDDPDPMAGFWAVPDHGYYEGEAIGVIVVADTDEIAEEGLRLVTVEWDILSFVLEADDALKPGALLNKDPHNVLETYSWDPNSNLLKGPTTWGVGPIGQKEGDVEAGFAEADKVIEFTLDRAEHMGHVEPNSSSVWWKDDHYEYATESQFGNSALGLAILGGHYNVGYQHPCYNGGSFGAGMLIAFWSINAAAFLSKRLMRPVKMMYTLQQSFYACIGMDAGQVQFKVGFKKDGTITAVQVDEKYPGCTEESSLVHFDDNTSIANLLSNYTAAYTNRPTTIFYRCEQRMPAMALNLVTTHVADALGMDPALVALKNDGSHGLGMDYLAQYKADHGFQDRDSLQECIDIAKKAIDFDNTWHAAGAKTLPDGRKHGLGFAWDHEWGDDGYTASCNVIIRPDGGAQIIAYHQDVGLNSASSICQVAAEELGLKYEDVYFKPNCEGYGIELNFPASSSNMCINGWAVKGACQKVRAQMLETATQGVAASADAIYNPTYENPNRKIPSPALFTGLKPQDLDIKDSVIFEKANPKNSHTVQELVDQSKAFQSAFFAFNYYNGGSWGISFGKEERLCRQAHFCEVAVDTETGEVEVLKVVNVNDVGKAISPEGVAGQQYGGTIMGISRGRNEEGVYDPSTGVRLNGNILDFKVATLRDCGPIDCHIVETAMGCGPYGAEGIGENDADSTAAILGPAVQNAIGVWIDSYPITPDKVLKALGKI